MRGEPLGAALVEAQAELKLDGRMWHRIAVPGLRAFTLVAALSLLGLAAQAQQPVAIDTSAIGPNVGERVPAFAGVDQFGREQTLTSSLGPKGVMLVFFRSADW